jgi:hypothetical protein
MGCSSGGRVMLGHYTSTCDNFSPSQTRRSFGITKRVETRFRVMLTTMTTSIRNGIPGESVGSSDTIMTASYYQTR